MGTEERRHSCRRWSRGHKARGQGQGRKKKPRPRTTLARTDSLEAKDRNAQGQGPRSQGHKRSQKKKVLKKFYQAISKKKILKSFFLAISKKKRSSKNFFRRSPVKKRILKFFSGDLQNFNNLKKSVVLKPRTSQFLRT